MLNQRQEKYSYEEQFLDDEARTCSEDHVANSTYAARKCAAVLAHAERIVAIELLCAYQGLQFRKPCRPGVGTGRLEALVADRMGDLFLDLGGFPGATRAERERSFRSALAELGLGRHAAAAVRPCVVEDVVLFPLLEAATELVREGAVARIAAGLTPRTGSS